MTLMCRWLRIRTTRKPDSALSLQDSIQTSSRLCSPLCSHQISLVSVLSLKGPNPNVITSGSWAVWYFSYWWWKRKETRTQISLERQELWCRRENGKCLSFSFWICLINRGRVTERLEGERKICEVWIRLNTHMYILQPFSGAHPRVTIQPTVRTEPEHVLSTHRGQRLPH